VQHPSLLPRVSFVGGSFLEEGQVPAAQGDGEVFVLRQILHDWSDADCIKILKQVGVVGGWVDGWVGVGGGGLKGLGGGLQPCVGSVGWQWRFGGGA
jgi:hypothetical protein